MPNILYIEVGSIQTRIILMRKGGKENRMEKLLVFPTPHGAVEDGMIRDTVGIGTRIRQELEGSGLGKTKKCIFTVFSSRIASREVNLPFVQASKLGAMVETNANDYFPVDLGKYVISYQIMGVLEKEEGKQYHLAVYAAPRSLTTSYIETAEQAGLQIQKIDYLGNSSFQTLKRTYPEGIHVLIKIEPESSLLTIIKDGNMALQRVLNYGVGGALETLRNLKAESIKSQIDALEILTEQRLIRGRLGGELPAGEERDSVLAVSMEVTDSLRFLCSNVQRILDYYLSRNVGEEIETFDLSGTGALCKGLDRLLANELGIEVLPAQFPEAIRTNGLCTEAEEQAYFLGAAGSVLNPVNLMQKVEKSKKLAKAESLKGSIVVLAVSVTACIVLTASTFIFYGIQKLSKSSLEDRIEKLQPLEQIFEDYTQACEHYSDFQEMYRYTKSPNEGLAEFLEEMEEKMPTAARVASLNVSGTEISLNMSASSKVEAAKVIQQLRSFESLMEVNVAGISIDDTGEVTFSVTASYVLADGEQGAEG